MGLFLAECRALLSGRERERERERERTQERERERERESEACNQVLSMSGGVVICTCVRGRTRVCVWKRE